MNLLTRWKNAFNRLNESNVVKIIRTLEINKIQGHDNIWVRMIKLCTKSVAADTFATNGKDQMLF